MKCTIEKFCVSETRGAVAKKHGQNNRQKAKITLQIYNTAYQNCLGI